MMCQVYLDQEKLVSGSLNLAASVGGSADFFEIGAKVVVFGFAAVDAFDAVDDDDDNDDNVSDVAIVAVSLN